MEPANSHVKVPSLLYYDKSGNVSAAGFEALSESTEDALKKGWTKAEWLVFTVLWRCRTQS